MHEKINMINKAGDKGQTSLYSGERISKSSLRVDTLGDLDELVCVLGVARYHAQKKRIKKEILDAQRDLFIAGSELATTKANKNKLPKIIDPQFLNSFEEKVKTLQEDTALRGGFVIPGNSLCASYLHQARTIARRCERKVVGLLEEKEIDNEHLLVYFNRLSVYLYLMAWHEDENPTFLKE